MRQRSRLWDLCSTLTVCRTTVYIHVFYWMTIKYGIDTIRKHNSSEIRGETSVVQCHWDNIKPGHGGNPTYLHVHRYNVFLTLIAINKLLVKLRNYKIFFCSTVGKFRWKMKMGEAAHNWFVFLSYITYQLNTFKDGTYWPKKITHSKERMNDLPQ